MPPRKRQFAPPRSRRKQPKRKCPLLNGIGAVEIRADKPHCLSGGNSSTNPGVHHMAMHRSAQTAALALGSLLLSASAVLADDATGTFSLRLENDFIGDTDGHYTHGSRLDWVSDKAGAGGPDFVRDTLQFLFPFGDIRNGRIGFALGQNIYTAQDTEREDPDPDDRPYAGWLYVGASLHGETPRGNGDFDTLDSVELDVGIVGPQAFGEQVQNGYHSLAGFGHAEGWDHQLKNEPAVVVFASRTWRSAPLSLGPVQFDALPQVDGSLGNVSIHAGAGGVLRVGHGLDVDYGPSRNPPSSSAAPVINPERDFAWYGFAGVNGRAVAHNIFLDGNTFVDSPGVDREVFVGDFRFGLAMIYSGWRLEFAETVRTKEFKEQDSVDRFATLTLSARF